MIAHTPTSSVCAAGVVVTLRVADDCFSIASILLEVVSSANTIFENSVVVLASMKEVHAHP